MPRTLSTDFLSGLLLMLAGSVFAYGSGAYDMGEASQMGPGYFPRLVAWLTIAVGVILVLRATLRRPGPEVSGVIGPWALRPLLLIIAANLGFGVMIAGLPIVGLPPMGLVPGVYLLTGLASLAEPGSRLRETFALATTLAVISVGITSLLSLNVPIWPEFL